ncbi:MAG: NYN domain-containing protein [Rhodobacteraceae bacterium]|nr:NYN domain-containing protein [Paracoccaceae bacterium]
MAELKRIAVFIDAENIPASYADALFTEIAKRGKIDFCRAFGDFSSVRMRAWGGKFEEHKIDAFQQDSVSNFKNAADIALVIGAMDLIHSTRYGRFYIVSNDGDFTPLANRIKSAGYDVIGFGAEGASLSFREACNDFVFLAAPTTKQAVKPVASKPVKAIMPLQKVNRVVDSLKSQDGWYSLSAIGKGLREAGVDYRKYGHAKLSLALQTLSGFEVSPQEKPNWMRRK